MNIFRNLGHVPAVSGLVKDDVDLIQRGGDRFAIADVAFDEFHFRVDPSRLAAAMRLWFEIIEHPNVPAFVHEQIGNVRPD